MPFETRRLELRHLTPDDTAVIYRLSQEEGMRRFLPDQVYADEAEAAGVLSFLIAQYALPVARSKAFVHAVVLKDSGELIGHVGLSPVGDDMEIGYAIAAAHQGEGYATEAVRATVRWALEEQGLPRVLGIVSRENLGSIRVLENAGFTFVDERERAMRGRPTVVRTYSAGRLPHAEPAPGSPKNPN